MIATSSSDAVGAEGAVVLLDEFGFDRSVGAARPTIVVFGGPGCPPCAAVKSILCQIAGEHAGRLRICEVRLDLAPGFVDRFGLSTMPTLIVFVLGEERKRITGVTDKAGLARALAEFLA